MIRFLSYSRSLPYRSFVKIPERSLDDSASLIKQKGRGDEDNYIHKIERND